ncbi:MAG: DUF3299 domain-containing protein [Bacteroidota bacterium]
MPLFSSILQPVGYALALAALFFAAWFTGVGPGWASETAQGSATATGRVVNGGWDAPLLQPDDPTWQLLMQADFQQTETPEGVRWLPTFPPEVEELDGTVVRLSGYMIPLGLEEEQTDFLISAFPGDGCFFHLPGGPNSVIEVKAERGVGFTYDTIPVEGRLELLRDDPYGLFYRMTEARQVK